MSYTLYISSVNASVSFQCVRVKARASLINEKDIQITLNKFRSIVLIPEKFELITSHFFVQPFFYLDIVDLQYSKPPETDVSARLNLNWNNKVLDANKVNVQVIPQL